MKFLRTLLKGVVVKKLIDLVKREARKPENQQKMKDAAKKLQNRRNRG